MSDPIFFFLAGIRAPLFQTGSPYTSGMNALRAPLLTPFKGQPPICDGLFKKKLRDTSLKLNHVAMAMRFRSASSRTDLFEFGSIQRLTEVPLSHLIPCH
jgi:hypothetical protein